MCLNNERFLCISRCIQRCGSNIGYARRSRDLLVAMFEAKQVCMYRRNSYRALSNRRALERASLRRGFDTASRRKAVVAVTSAVRGAPPLAEGRERPRHEGERHRMNPCGDPPETAPRPLAAPTMLLYYKSPCLSFAFFFHHSQEHF